MNDTMVTVVGNVATQVDYRETATGGMARFRVAVTPRRWDRQRESWTDGRTSFYTVFAWRTLAANLAGSLSVGDPVVVHGRLRVREEERETSHDDSRGTSPGTSDGGVQRRTFVDIEAVSAGHDLTRGTSAFRRVARGAPNVTERQPEQPGHAEQPGETANARPADEWAGHHAGVAAASPGGSEDAAGMAAPPF
ncbi:single-stranded DNA-binding protein [Streptomyces sp. NPDC014894]|uniref:single-stranded DNA-binding protein n=1 Tax=unclassified Streptomyces TaxID=2593676 RepID=UPI0036F6D46C